MDLPSLLAPLTPRGLPAPVWFLQFFKLVGFILHVIPMHLLYAGTPLIAGLLLARGEHSRRLAGRLARLMPFVVALAVNFGIVPLLFVQVTFYRAFYPATILMAWPWFCVVLYLIVAYYGLYYLAAQVKSGEPNRLAIRWTTLGALLVMLIGFTFANAFSLMVNVEAWPGLWEQTNAGGAVTGLALNTGDPTLPWRWLMMFGLALTTSAVWIVADSALLAKGETPEYRAWADGFARRVYTAGVVLAGVCGAIYLGLALPAEDRAFLLGGPMVVFTLLTGVAPLAALATWRGAAGFGRLALIQAVVIVLNAVSRQMLQTHELAAHWSPAEETVTTQWSTLPAFLVIFVATLAFVGWLLVRCAGEMSSKKEVEAA